MNNEDFLVIGRTNGTTRNGSPYVMLKVANKTETLNINVWDVMCFAEKVHNRY